MAPHNRLGCLLYTTVGFTTFVIVGVFRGPLWLAVFVGYFDLLLAWIGCQIYLARHPDWWPPWDDGLPRGMRITNIFVPVGIVLTLSLILFPVFSQARQTAANTVSVSNLKAISAGMYLYSLDHKDLLPDKMDAPSVSASLERYLKNPNALVDPHNQRPYQFNVSLAGRNLDEIQNKENVVLAFEAASAPDHKRAVAFLDGHAKRITEAEWTEFNRPYKAPQRR